MKVYSRAHRSNIALENLLSGDDVRFFAQDALDGYAYCTSGHMDPFSPNSFSLSARQVGDYSYNIRLFIPDEIYEELYLSGAIDITMDDPTYDGTRRPVDITDNHLIHSFRVTPDIVEQLLPFCLITGIHTSELQLDPEIEPMMVQKPAAEIPFSLVHLGDNVLPMIENEAWGPRIIELVEQNILEGASTLECY